MLLVDLWAQYPVSFPRRTRLHCVYHHMHALSVRCVLCVCVCVRVSSIHDYTMRTMHPALAHLDFRDASQFERVKYLLSGCGWTSSLSELQSRCCDIIYWPRWFAKKAQVWTIYFGYICWISFFFLFSFFQTIWTKILSVFYPKYVKFWNKTETQTQNMRQLFMETLWQQMLRDSYKYFNCIL